jgi:hypothetical protein
MGFTGNDGSALAGGLNPSGVVKALSVDASGNLNVNASVSSGPTNITQISSANVGATNGLPVSGNNSGSLVVIGVDGSGRLILVPNTAFNVGQWNGSAPGAGNPVITEDQIRAYTIAGNAYSATTGKLVAPGSATLGFQLFNPANNTKNILIYSLIIANVGAGLHQMYKTSANVNTITGWSDVAATITNNGANAAASTAVASYSNVNVTGGLLGTARELTGNSANAPVEVLTNGECIWLPAGVGAIAGIAVYFNATGANAWGITCEYLEF